MSSEVVNFPSAGPLPEQPIQMAERGFNLCRHDRITLDDHDRTVRCVECGQVFDAFSYLHSNALSIQRAWMAHREVMRRVQEKTASLEALAKEEKRLKARVKTLKEKAEPGIDIKGKWL